MSTRRSSRNQSTNNSKPTPTQTTPVIDLTVKKVKSRPSYDDAKWLGEVEPITNIESDKARHGMELFIKELVLNTRYIFEVDWSKALLSKINSLGRSYRVAVRTYLLKSVHPSFLYCIHGNEFRVAGEKHYFLASPRLVSDIIDELSTVDKTPLNSNYISNRILTYKENDTFKSIQRIDIESFPTTSPLLAFEWRKIKAVKPGLYDHDISCLEYVKPEDEQKLTGKYTIRYKNAIGFIRQFLNNDAILLSTIQDDRGVMRCRHYDTYYNCTRKYQSKVIVESEEEKLIKQMHSIPMVFQIKAKISPNGFITIYDASGKSGKSFTFRYPKSYGWTFSETIDIGLHGARFEQDIDSMTTGLCNKPDCFCTFDRPTDGISKRDPDYQIRLDSDGIIEIDSLLHMEAHFTLKLPSPDQLKKMEEDILMKKLKLNLKSKSPRTATDDEGSDKENLNPSPKKMKREFDFNSDTDNDNNSSSILKEVPQLI